MVKDAKDGGIAIASKHIEGAFLFVRHASGIHHQ